MSRIRCCASDRTDPISASSVVIQEVFSKSHYRDCSETISFFCLSNVPKAHIEASLAVIGRHVALNGKFNHLKRIKGSTTLLAPVGEGETAARFDRLIRALGESNHLADEMEIAIIPVPRFAALTKQQYVASNAIWPVRVITPLVDPELPLEGARKSLAVAKINKLISSSVGSNGVCVYDSADDSVSITGYGTERNSPFHFRHAVFDASDKVGKVAEYLATDYSVFCLSEPCIMCSMALLHSRVKEVFFLHEPVSGGVSGSNGFHGLGSSVAVHCEKQLNHHFKAYRISLVPS